MRESLVGLVRDLGDLARIRNSAYASENNASQTVEGYHRLITHLLDLSQDMAEATSNPEMIQRTRALAAFSSAKEYASIQRAIIAAALPTGNTTFGKLSESDRLYGEGALESEESDLSGFRSIYGTDSAIEILKPVEEGNPTIQATDQYGSRAMRSGLSDLDKRSYKDWVDDSSIKIEQMGNIEHTLLEDMEQKARELRNESERDAIISGALILLVLGISLVGAFVVARSMIRSLRRLQETATKVAQDRLPELVKQLSESDPQDVDTSVESVGVHSRDEIGQVAAAFDDVHREAVRLAAEQALLRGNVNAMFTNLSRRSQGLIQRQLSLISELESREADPDQLSSLFKLDHLATRMRRNGENLLVLAGEEPGRRWTRPVPLVDVLRAAASEVEQYERIELASVPTTEVAGRVVNDLVHLLAELLENATSFSSPQTKVKVTGHALPDGRVLIEIHDTGIGLSPEDLAAINERLASPPTVDVSVSRRMGLFVVGRLSQRHGIRIQLRPSDSGGTTALVMLPVDVAQGGKKPQPKPGQGAGGGAAAAAAAGVAAARRGTGQPGGALGAGAPGGGLLGAGQGPRAALPGRDAGGRPGAPGGAHGPQGPGAPQQGRPAPAGAGAGFGGQAPGAPQGLQAAGTGGPQGRDPFGGGQDPFGGGPDPFGSGQARSAVPGVPYPRSRRLEGSEQQGRRRRPQLPGRGGPRAELPGGNRSPAPPAGATTTRSRRCRAPRWTPRAATTSRTPQTSRMPRIDDRQGPGATTEIPAIPRFENRQGPASTSEFARPDYDAPAPGAPQNTGQFPRRARAAADRTARTAGPRRHRRAVRPLGHLRCPERPSGTATSRPRASSRPRRATTTAPAASSRGPVTTAAPPTSSPSPATTTAPRGSTPCRAARARRTPRRRRVSSSGPGPTAAARLRAPRPPAPQRPQQRPDEGRGRVTASNCRPRAPVTAVLRCTTRWRPTGSTGSRTLRRTTTRRIPSRRPHSRSRRPRQPPNVPPPAPGAARRTTTSSGRRSASGSRRRAGSPPPACRAGYPRANLVAGTAQQQQHQSGPQVSRAPDDVRGRLTNLRRGIQQGRQAGTGADRQLPEPHSPAGALVEPDEPGGTEPQLVDHQLRGQHPRGVPHRRRVRRRPPARACPKASPATAPTSSRPSPPDSPR